MNPRRFSPAGTRLFELQLAALYRAQHAWPVQQLPPSQQSAERDVARAVPITAAIAAIKMRYFIIPPVDRFSDSSPKRRRPILRRSPNVEAAQAGVPILMKISLENRQSIVREMQSQQKTLAAIEREQFGRAPSNNTSEADLDRSCTRDSSRYHSPFAYNSRFCWSPRKWFGPATPPRKPRSQEAVRKVLLRLLAARAQDSARRIRVSKRRFRRFIRFLSEGKQQRDHSQSRQHRRDRESSHGNFET